MTALAYRLPEAAALVGLRPETLRRLVQRGELRAVRAGRAVLIRADELQRFIDTLPAWEPGADPRDRR